MIIAGGTCYLKFNKREEFCFEQNSSMIILIVTRTTSPKHAWKYDFINQHI